VSNFLNSHPTFKNVFYQPGTPLLAAVSRMVPAIPHQGDAMKKRNKTNRKKAALKTKIRRKSLRKSKGERKYPS
jgi:hypothetical protein